MDRSVYIWRGMYILWDTVLVSVSKGFSSLIMLLV